MILPTSNFKNGSLAVYINPRNPQRPKEDSVGTFSIHAKNS